MDISLVMAARNAVIQAAAALEQHRVSFQAIMTLTQQVGVAAQSALELSNLAGLRELKSTINDALEVVDGADFTWTVEIQPEGGHSLIILFDREPGRPLRQFTAAFLRRLLRLLSRRINSLQRRILLQPEFALTPVVIQRAFHVLHGAHPPREAELLRVPQPMSPRMAAVPA